MKKISTVFQIQWIDHTRGDVLREVNPENQWVMDGEGIATRKWDGTACMVRNGVLFKRYDRKINPKTGEYKPAPDGWEACQEPDPVTKHYPGWVPITDKPDDQWFRQAWNDLAEPLPDGTYELIGPQINGNPERVMDLIFHKHGDVVYDIPERTYDTLRQFLVDNEIEGVVFHHPDGRMAKIKRRDYGLTWTKKGNEE